ncbi:helix-turn-helix transcriptional regulator, partial [Klebsiella pneumoniae]
MKENTENNVKRFIRVPDVLNRVGFSRTTLYERIKEGNFPDRVKIGPREGANKQVISSQADSLIKISRIWAD